MSGPRTGNVITPLEHVVLIKHGPNTHTCTHTHTQTFCSIVTVMTVILNHDLFKARNHSRLFLFSLLCCEIVKVERISVERLVKTLYAVEMSVLNSRMN